MKWGFIYQGQRSRWQKRPRGTPSRGLPATAFVSFLQNHDQVSNSPTGQRIHELTSPGRYRAMTALWLLSPQTPLFFQGQEFAASSPFMFFADYTGEIAEAIRRGRAQFLSQFPVVNSAAGRQQLPDSMDPTVFDRCKLNFSQRQKHKELYQLHIDLLKLRRDDPVFRMQRADRLETAILDAECLAVRFYGDDDHDRLLIANFGPDLHWPIAPEPLLAPPRRKHWQALWNSNDHRYGGRGVVPFESSDEWYVTAESTLVLQAIGQDPPPATEPAKK